MGIGKGTRYTNYCYYKCSGHSFWVLVRVLDMIPTIDTKKEKVSDHLRYVIQIELTVTLAKAIYFLLISEISEVDCAISNKIYSSAERHKVSLHILL